MTAEDLRSIAKEHEKQERRRRSGHAPDAHKVHEDRGALLGLLRGLSRHIAESRERQGRCPICEMTPGADEDWCPAPLLESLR